MKQTELPVSPAFIIKAHGLACAAWKTKLEELYPSVFKDEIQTFKIGDKVKILSHSNPEIFIVAQIARGRLMLISAASGNRYNGAEVRLSSDQSVNSIPVSYLKVLTGKRLDNLQLNGKALSEKKKVVSSAVRLTSAPTLIADIELIKSAYGETASTEIKNMITDYFPEVFSTPGYATLIADKRRDKFELSTSLKTIDGIQLTIGNGIAPKGLQYKTITGYVNEAEVEVIYDDCGMFHVAFKKK